MQNDELLVYFVSDLKDILKEVEKLNFGFAKMKLQARINEIVSGKYLPLNPKPDEQLE